jgi:hypothetical protein
MELGFMTEGQLMKRRDFPLPAQFVPPVFGARIFSPNYLFSLFTLRSILLPKEQMVLMRPHFSDSSVQPFVMAL